MKKINYNQFTKSDIPLNSSFAPSVMPDNFYAQPKKKEKKQSIKAIGRATQQRILQARAMNNAQVGPQGYPMQRNMNPNVQNNIQRRRLEDIDDNNVAAYAAKARRNKTIIIILIILLIISLLMMGLFMIFTDAKSNCFVNVHGDYNTTVYVDNQELNKFITPAGINGNRMFEIDTDILINVEGEFSVKFVVKCYNNDNLMENTQVVMSSTLFQYNPLTQMYESSESIAGGQRVDMFDSVLLDVTYENSITVKSFKLYIDIYVAEFQI